MYFIRKEFKQWRCPKGGLSHYKIKDGQQENDDEVTKDDLLANAIWYLSIISRVNYVFVNPNDAKNFIWP